jgi:hypothetical protein
MPALRRRSFLLAAAAWPVAAQTPAAPTRKWQGSWSATGAGKLLLRGTWTASPGQGLNVLTGGWTLRDERGQIRAGGTWSATKAEDGWQGHWRALVSKGPGSGGRNAGQFSGSWTTRAPLAGTGALPVLFEHAIKSVVSGQWFIGRNSGAWSIRAEPENEFSGTIR